MIAFWFRRDLRIMDNAGLYEALRTNQTVLPVFIFDQNILDELEDKEDKRVEFIHGALLDMQDKLVKMGSSLCVRYGKPLDVWQQLAEEYQLEAVYTNRDYEPYAIQRDQQVQQMLAGKGIGFHSFKDQVVFETTEVVKDNGTPFEVYTPYSRKWKAKLTPNDLQPHPSWQWFRFLYKTEPIAIPSLQDMGFRPTGAEFPPKVLDEDLIRHYHELRDIPAAAGTSRISVHLRFGTVSIRALMSQAMELNEKYWNELIWREFYQMILAKFPHVVTHAFKPDYDRVPWRHDEREFGLWCQGLTGYPIVDAGMRELNATGYMHNRVRMIVASFLTKDLLIDWRWGEAYFARKLLDFDLASNNGGWQWAAGTGVDAAPYFRVFNPSLQAAKFDPNGAYIRKWVPELDSFDYPRPIVEHSFARDRALKTYKQALGG